MYFSSNTTKMQGNCK